MSKKILVDQIFKPNSEGFSEWVTRETLDDTPLKLGNNGSSRHGIMWGVSDYLWEIHRKNDKTTGKIEKLRLVGLNDDSKIGRPIGRKVRDFYKGKPCVFCGNSDIIIDHKNDLYNDPRVLKVETQTVEDFQPLCNACNLRKRQVCKKSKEEGKRYAATRIPMLAIFGIDFIEGDETLDVNDPNAMVGTFWYDPERFMKFIHQGLSKAQ